MYGASLAVSRKDVCAEGWRGLWLSLPWKPELGRLAKWEVGDVHLKRAPWPLAISKLISAGHERDFTCFGLSHSIFRFAFIG
jgi:hypothetical protein